MSAFSRVGRCDEKGRTLPKTRAAADDPVRRSVVPERVPSPPRGPGEPRADAAFWVLVSGTVVVGAWTTSGVVGRLLDPQRTVSFMTTLLTCWGAVAAGVVLHQRRRDNAMGTLLVLLGLGLFLEDLQVNARPLPHAIGIALVLASVGPAAHVVLAYPRGRLEDLPSRLCVLSGYLTSLLLGPLAMPTDGVHNAYRVRAYAEHPGEFFGWPTWVERVYSWVHPLDLDALAQVAGAVVGVAVVGVLAARWVRLDGPTRRVLTPVLACSAAATAAGALLPVVTHVQRLNWLGFPVGMTYRLLALGVVLLLLLGSLRERIGSRFGAIVGGLGHAADVTGLRDAARGALGDPTLGLAEPDVVTGWFVDTDGAVVLPDVAGAGRMVSPVTHGGRVLALLTHHPTAASDEHAFGAVTAALGLALERRRVERESSRREVSQRAAHEELATAHRQVELSLHDGVQAQLVAALVTVRQAETTHDPVLLGRAATTLEQALADVRRLSHGIRPPLLQEQSLGRALERLAADSPVPVTLVATGDLTDLPESVADTGYRVVAEGMTNALKHGRARHLTLTADAVPGRIEVTVADDGGGGAHLVPGGGLARLTDAVVALGGNLLVDGVHGGTGSRLVATIPLGAP